MERIKEIEKRMAEIAEELNNPDADVDALANEVDTLQEEKRKLMEIAEKRKKTLENVVNSTNVVESEEIDARRKDENREYRTAFLKRLLGQNLNDAEERALALTGTSGALPVSTSEEIIKKISQRAPMLEEITLLHVPGQVKFAVEGTKSSGSVHTENATINGDADTLISVSLGGYEITKLIQISKSVERMSINAFEEWLIDMISDMVAEKIEDLIFNGSGTNEPKGINKITYTSGTNAVQVAKDAEITANNIRSLIALLPGGYDSGAKFFMQKKTLFGRIMGLQDNSKHELVKCDNGKYYIYGYEVKLSDKAPANELILGNAKKYVGNLSEEIEVHADFDINSNSNKYLGCAIFDGKPAIEEAFVKLVQLTA